MVLVALSAKAVRKDDEATAIAAASASLPAATASKAPKAPAQEEDVTAPADDQAADDQAADDQAADDAAEDEGADEVAPVGAPTGTYAGSVNGGGASVAIAVKGDTAIAYVCDGSKVEAWMQGAADVAALKLQGKNGAALNAKYSDGRLSGTIKAAGKKYTFKVKTVEAPSGLYRSARNVRNAKVVGGWIVYKGNQVGMLNRSGVETPAPPIDLKTGMVTIDGTSVQTDPVDGSSLD
jgi:serine/threonine-protein kinase